MPPGLPLNFLKLEQQLMSYRSMHTVSEAHMRAQQINWFNIFVSESFLAMPPGFPLEFLRLEELLMTYRSVHIVIGASALALRYARGLIFSAFHRHPIFVGVCQRNHLDWTNRFRIT